MRSGPNLAFPNLVGPVVEVLAVVVAAVVDSLDWERAALGVVHSTEDDSVHSLRKDEAEAVYPAAATASSLAEAVDHRKLQVAVEDS